MSSSATSQPAVAVIGCGYLGAVHAACLAKWGFRTVGIDPDAGKVASLSSGRAPFLEDGLDPLLESGVRSGLLTFTTDPSALADCHMAFVCVGTPQQAASRAADLSQVRAAVEDCARYLPTDSLVVGKSTVPVGTSADLAAQLAVAGLRLAWNPEFLREGTAVRDTLNPERVVVGVTDQRSSRELRDLYAEPCASGSVFVVTDPATAELTKQAANAFLATKISFMNAVAELCERSGADVADLAYALGLDARIGPKFLGAGIGYGGGCFPKDIRALAERSRELGAARLAELLETADLANLDARRRVRDLALNLLPDGGTAAVLGATFKPGSDDTRDSPAVWLASELVRSGLAVQWYDPAFASGYRLADLSMVGSAEEAARGADLVIVATDWSEFHQLDPGALEPRTKAVVDGRNMLDASRWIEAGWTYVGVGRHTPPARG